MSTLAPAQWIYDICEKHDVFEYRILILITLPDGKQLVTDSEELANKLQAEGAETRHVTELGE